MDILSIIAITLSGIGVLAFGIDKIISQFQKDSPDAEITIVSSCCFKDNHSRRRDDNHS